MDKREQLINTYIILLFGVLNLFCNEFNFLAINLRTLLLFAVTFVTFIYYVRQGTGPYNWKKLTRTDWLISGIMIITLICLIYRICTGIADVNQEIVLLAIGVMYFVLHKYEVDIRAVFGVLCISNYIVYAMMLLSYITKGWSSPLIKFLKGNGGATAWLLLGVAVTMLSYCTSRRRKLTVFYGIGMLLGSFLLFMEKNMTAILIIEGLIISLPFIFKPEKRFIKRVIEIFLCFNFLLCNMSLLTGYVEIFKGDMIYDLEVSVYMELVLAVAALAFFTLWDKHTTEEDEMDTRLPELLPFFQLVAVVAIIFIGALFAAATRGSSVVLPDVMYKLLSLFILSIAEQNGIFYTIGERYGIVGAVAIMVLLAVIAIYCLRKTMEDTREQKLSKCIMVIYVVQSIFLKQTVLTTPLYAAIIIMYLKGTVEKERNVLDEADNSDTVL